MMDTLPPEKVGSHVSDDKTPDAGRITNDLGMTFVYISPGDFVMGSPPDEPGRKSNEVPHRVTLTRGFYMMTTEVTQKQWQAVMGNNPSVFDRCGGRCPVENVSWQTVNQLIKKINGRKGLKLIAKNMNDGEAHWLYALPTEAQWEYACRAGSRGWFNFNGDAWGLSDYGWYKRNSNGQPHEVGLKKANPYGLYDMHGNVWEWCRDFSGTYPAKPVTDPTGPGNGRFRIARGGSWYYPAMAARSANRLALPPGMGNYNVGFRLVLVKKN